MTTYITSDILNTCTGRSGRCGYFDVPDADMNGYRVILRKNHKSALNATALTGRNLAKQSKRRWFEVLPKTTLQLIERHKT